MPDFPQPPEPTAACGPQLQALSSLLSIYSQVHPLPPAGYNYERPYFQPMPPWSWWGIVYASIQRMVHSAWLGRNIWGRRQ